jgi:phosphoribosyl 1,2-cyclic phosphodiesterase
MSPKAQKGISNGARSIKFLGTAGARFVVLRQLRASGGIWLKWDDINALIDPGPGTLVRALKSRPILDPAKLDVIILTHRHLDHCADVNVIIEAMTQGGFKKRGILFCPRDALGDDPVVFKYLRGYLDKIEILDQAQTYKISESLFLNTPLLHKHPVQTYGLNFKKKEEGRPLLSVICDTLYFKELEKFYKGRILVINVVFARPHTAAQHLSLIDAQRLIDAVRPKVAILTHFGMTMLKERPHEIAKALSEKLGLEVIAAYDGMEFKF